MDEIKNEHLGAAPPPPPDNAPAVEWAVYYGKLGYAVVVIHGIDEDGNCTCGNRANHRVGKHPVHAGYDRPEYASVEERKIRAMFDDTYEHAVRKDGWKGPRPHSRWQFGIKTGWRYLPDPERGGEIHDLSPVVPFVVLDPDVKKGKDGVNKLATVYERYEMVWPPETLTVNTPTGGLHLYYDLPSPTTLGTKENVFHSQLGIKNTDIDLLGSGVGYVVAPGCRAPGGVYKAASFDQQAPATLDPRLFTILRGEGDYKRTESTPKQRSQKKSAPTVEAPAELTVADVKELLTHVRTVDCNDWFKAGVAIKYALTIELGLPDEESYQIFDWWCREYAGGGTYDAADNWEQWRGFKTDLPEGKQPRMGSLIFRAQKGGWRPAVPLEKQLRIREMFDAWIYVVEMKRFYNMLDPRQTLDKEQFNDEFRGLLDPKLPAHMCVLRPGSTLRRIRAVTYWPGQERFIVENGVEKLNLWTDPGISQLDELPDSAITAGVQPFLDHIARLLPDPIEAGYVLDRLAFMVQRPGVKIRHIVLLHSEINGNGKSFICDVMRKVLGDDNAHPVANEAFGSGWNKDWSMRQVVFVEELQTDGHKGEQVKWFNRFKTVFASDFLDVNEKMQPRFRIANRINFWAFSNYEQALVLTKYDRRVLVLKSDAPMLTKAEFNALFEWLNQKSTAAYLKTWFMRRDLSGFDPNEPAPTTVAKETLIESSKHDLVKWLEDMIDLRHFCFGRDLLTAREVVGAAKEQGVYGVNNNTVAEALRKAGAVALPWTGTKSAPNSDHQRQYRRRTEPNGETVRLWAIRDHAEWLKRNSLDPQGVADEYFAVIDKWKEMRLGRKPESAQQELAM